MDPLVAAAGTALVQATVTDAWQQAKAAVVELWRRVHPEQASSLGAELDSLQAQILQARQDGDVETENDLEGSWRIKLQQLLLADPRLVVELQRVLRQVLTPALTAQGQARIQTITAGSRAHPNVAGRDVNQAGGDLYIAGHDQTIHRP